MNLTMEPLQTEYGISSSINNLDKDAIQALGLSVTSYLDGIKDYGFPKKRIIYFSLLINILKIEGGDITWKTITVEAETETNY